MSEIPKCPKCRRGGGVNPNWDIVPNFLFFISDASPKYMSVVARRNQPTPSEEDNSLFLVIMVH